MIDDALAGAAQDDHARRLCSYFGALTAVTPASRRGRAFRKKAARTGPSPIRAEERNTQSP
jgi:hypothetical protein